MEKRRRYTRAEQQGWVKQWRASGLSGVQFAGEQGLNKATLYGWGQRHGLGEEDGIGPVEVASERPKARFTEVRLEQRQSSEAGTIEVVLAGGQVVRVRGAVESAQLRQVLEALAGC